MDGAGYAPLRAATRGLWALLLGAGLALAAAPAEAESFIFGDEPIHPACVHALVMEQGDRISVVGSVRLDGCMASSRARSKPRNERDWLLFEDEELLGQGAFGYRHIASLDNGLFVLGIVRIQPDDSEIVSLAVVRLATRPVLRNREVVDRLVMETIGEVWIEDLQMPSVRTIGNVVHFSAGVGPAHVEQTVDLSRIGRATR